jgi:uncharacterized protein YjbJ (UPF0337 family)
MQTHDTNRAGKRDFIVNEDTLKGKWKEMKGGVQKMWGKLTDDDLEKAKGDLTSLSGIIQQRYGRTKEEVDRDLSDYFAEKWSNVKAGAARVAEKAKNAVDEASESAKNRL